MNEAVETFYKDLVELLKRFQNYVNLEHFLLEKHPNILKEFEGGKK